MYGATTGSKHSPKGVMSNEMRKWIAGGGAVGLVFVSWTTVVRLLGGEAAFTGVGSSYPLVATVYLVGGLLAGLIAGLTSKWPDNDGTAALRGGISGALIGALIQIARKGVSYPIGESIPVVLTISSMCALVAVMLARDARRRG